MCRFLMVTSQRPFQAAPWLEEFAEMAERSRAPDGDRQADGWGASWLDGEKRWRSIKSTAPIWTERASFKVIPAGCALMVHARSASFPGHKNVLEYNQPFIEGSYAFVFNGLLKGVSLPGSNGGGIGSQKIWNLCLGLLKHDAPDRALDRLTGLLDKRTKEISALNIGISDGARLYVYCRYKDHPEYYQLQVAEAPGLTAVCSEPLAGRSFRPLRTDRVLVFESTPVSKAVKSAHEPRGTGIWFP